MLRCPSVRDHPEAYDQLLAAIAKRAFIDCRAAETHPQNGTIVRDDEHARRWILGWFKDWLDPDGNITLRLCEQFGVTLEWLTTGSYPRDDATRLASRVAHPASR